MGHLGADIGQIVETIASHDERWSTRPDYLRALKGCAEHLCKLGYSRQDRRKIRVHNRISWNLEARWKKQERAPLVLVTAHLDSTNREGPVDNKAPGADDNASGCAALLHLAEYFHTRPIVAPRLRFILFGGEEQGMWGSTQYVERLLEEPNRPSIRAVLNLDTIGRDNREEDPFVVRFHGEQPSRWLVERLEQECGCISKLSSQKAHRTIASDHLPFLDAGFPAVLITEGEGDPNRDVNTSNDVYAKVSIEQVQKIADLLKKVIPTL